MWNKERFLKAQYALANIKENFSADQVHTVAAFDVSFQKGTGIGVVALFSYGSQELIECYTLVEEPFVPYVPTFLAFREMPYIMALYNRLSTKPDLLLIDGHGRCHPRRMGIATQAGLALRVPSIGVAKSYLYGEIVEMENGTFVVDPTTGEFLAYVYREKPRFNPVFISIGAGVPDLKMAVDLVLPLYRGHREPEPLRYVHNVSLNKGRMIKDGVQQAY
jgi:deoxyribonuclease V